MPGRSDIFRAAAIVVLIAAFIATFITISLRSPAPVVETPSTATPPAHDDLSAELRRCSTLGQRDAEDAHCVAVWEENRRRFFGGPARPLPPQSLPGTAAPATSSSGNAR